MDDAEDFDDPDEGLAIADALGERERSDELRAMAAALGERRAQIALELSGAADPKLKSRLSRRLSELDGQIDVLRQEAAITEFVERSVRATLHGPRDLDQE